MEPGLTLDDVHVAYGKREILAGVSLHAGAGEIVGLLGPNGVGKSTTLKAAAGLLPITAGRVTVAGIDMAANPDLARRSVGYLPDVGGLFTRLSVWEHLELAARMWQLGDGWERRAGALLERLTLGGYRDQPAAQLSHGTMRRCGIAVAFMSRPAVVLLDEPFDGVDPIAARAIRELAREHADQGAAVVASTHLLDVAERTCDRMVLFAAGRVAAHGTAAELRAASGEPGPLEDTYVALVTGQP